MIWHSNLYGNFFIEIVHAKLQMPLCWIAHVQGTCTCMQVSQCKVAFNDKAFFLNAVFVATKDKV
jgi:hypothetical protein